MPCLSPCTRGSRACRARHPTSHLAPPWSHPPVPQWVQSAGGALSDPDQGAVEVSPLVSYAGEGLEPLVAGRVFEEAYDLDLQVGPEWEGSGWFLFWSG